LQTTALTAACFSLVAAPRLRYAGAKAAGKVPQYSIKRKLRNMNLHEYQAKIILADYGVPVPAGLACSAPEEAAQAFKDIGGESAVIKAQIHGGGRGKAGGIKIVSSPEEAASFAKEMLGKKLITRQTGPQGKIVSAVLVEEPLDIAREIYLSLTLDRMAARPVLMVSKRGGVDIEEAAGQDPGEVSSIHIDPIFGLRPFQAWRACTLLEIHHTLCSGLMKTIFGMGRAFFEKDARLIEINPFVITKDGRALACDAKMVFDDNGLYRNRKLLDMRDPTQEDPREVETEKRDLSYVGLDGAIGCMVNGAGLAMATMDLIRYHGAKPANFLDVGGGATLEKVSAGFKIILKDENVKAILVNIFGGVVRCNIIAEGITGAVREIKLDVPLVVRLEGTAANEGKELLHRSGLAMTVADSLEEGARKAVELAG